MAKSKKILTPAARKAREAFARNVQRRIRMAYPHITLTAALKQIGDNTGHSLSTLQDAAKGTRGLNSDTAADIAHHFGCEVPELFAREIGTDSPKPRLVKSSQGLK